MTQFIGPASKQNRLSCANTSFVFERVRLSALHEHNRLLTRAYCFSPCARTYCDIAHDDAFGFGKLNWRGGRRELYGRAIHDERNVNRGDYESPLPFHNRHFHARIIIVKIPLPCSSVTERENGRETPSRPLLSVFFLKHNNFYHFFFF